MVNNNKLNMSFAIISYQKLEGLENSVEVILSFFGLYL